MGKALFPHVLINRFAACFFVYLMAILQQTITSGAPMPTQKRRIQISLDPALDEVLVRLTDLLKKPTSKIIAELLLESLPALLHIADALEQAKAGKLDIDSFQKVLGVAHSELDEISEFLESKRQGDQ